MIRVREFVTAVAGLDWLTSAAWLLTLGCLGCAILDSYTSLCVVGGSLGHIGDVGACPAFGGWDTRVFPLAVDMGWGGALFAVLRLARVIGLASWRWWVVLTFEVVTAAFTIAGNAFHGAVVDGAASHVSAVAMVVITCVASAVPGVVAVGSGFTLSVLVSTRSAEPVAPGRTREPALTPEPYGGRSGAQLEPAALPATAVAQNGAARGPATRNQGRRGSAKVATQKSDRNGRLPALEPPPALDQVVAQLEREGQEVSGATVGAKLGISKTTANRRLGEWRKLRVVEAAGGR